MKKTLQRLQNRLTIALQYAVPGIALATVLAISSTTQAQDVSGDNLNLTDNDRANILANGANTDSLGIFVQGEIIQSMDSSSLSIFKRMDLELGLPEIRFIPTNKTGFELEADDNFEISADGAGLGAGMFKILGDAKSDALTLTANGIVVGGEESTENLSVVGDGLRSSLELVPDFGQDPNARIVVENTDNTLSFEARGTSPTFNPIFRASLDASEDAITIQPGGLVSLGVPFSTTDPFVNSPLVRLRVTDHIFFDGTSSDWLPGTFGDFFGVATPGTSPPFAVHKDAGVSALIVGDGGNVGVGINAPDASLHVIRDDGTALMRVEEASATPARRKMLELINNGPSKLEMTNTDSGRTWSIVADFNDSFNIRQNGPNTANMAIRADGTFSFNNGGEVLLSIRPDGNAFLPQGTLTELSDRNSKENIEAIDPSEVLNKVVELPLNKWNYISDKDDAQHLGPMAQDFYAAFGLGNDEKRIATIDTSGVALAAVQGLNQKLESEVNALKAQNEELLDQNDELLTRMEQLEQMVEALTTR